LDVSTGGYVVLTIGLLEREARREEDREIVGVGFLHR